MKSVINRSERKKSETKNRYIVYVKSSVWNYIIIDTGEVFNRSIFIIFLSFFSSDIIFSQNVFHIDIDYRKFLQIIYQWF